MLTLQNNDQQVRGTVTLPEGTGKEIKIAIFTSDEFKHIAEKTNADKIVDLNYISEITADNLDFDQLLATKDVIKLLKPFGRTIGRLGSFIFIFMHRTTWTHAKP